MQPEEKILPNGGAELLPQPAETESDTPYAPALYDADAEQIVPVTVEDDGEEFELLLRTNPVSDHLVRLYAKARAAGEDDADGFAPKIAAAEKFFPQFVRGPEGVEGDVPADWAGIFGAQDMLAIVTTLLLCERVNTPVTKGKQLKEWRVSTTSKVRLRCYFNGGLAETLHVFNKASAKPYADYARGALGGADELEQLDALAEVYDKLHVSHEGYRGRVPIFHKAAAVRVHLERIVRVTRKN